MEPLAVKVGRVAANPGKGNGAEGRVGEGGGGEAITLWGIRGETDCLKCGVCEGRELTNRVKSWSK